MLLPSLLAVAAAVAPVWAADAVKPMAAGIIMEALDPRALPNSPSGGYAPAIVDCPAARPTIRSASSLSPNETAWLTRRRSATVEPMRDLLTRAGIPNFDAGAYIDRLSSSPSQLPNVAIAVSGGGYRALMNGAGFLAAADSRTPGSTSAGGIGGLLQSATYLAGLSGGGWLVGSIFSNNFSSVVDLQRGSPGSAVWKFDRSIFSGPRDRGISIVNTAEYWRDISRQVDSKDQGFEVSITDYWGRALSYQLINATDGGPAYTFSSIAESPDFQAGAQPFPILVTDGRAPGERIISLNATVYEFNPFELGTWDNTAFGFAPLAYLASNFSAGRIADNGSCVRGFDQAGFVMGTSSSLFNQFLLQNISTTGLPDFIQSALTSILNLLDEDNNDIAQYVPNPFFGWNPRTNVNANQSQLTLVDGGEDLQNIPLHPLIQPNRAVDVIFAVDSSADTNFNWPNGTALRATYDRVAQPIANGTLFPPVPDANTFINLGLNRRPAFFGCDASNFTLRSGQRAPPLVVYIPNAPYVAHSNVSTFDPSYDLDQRDAIIQNGYDAATQGNATLDAEWPVCVACAILSRNMVRNRQPVPAACTTCFQRYCWNGTLDTRDVGEYEPAFAIGKIESNSPAARAGVSPVAGIMGAAAAAVALAF
ncbi:lysophospholipase catalytic domain-containing protein [Colletotrichum graminicola]|uniref:Lysophospholipase n=1 Tax=Colletotrichum graminicola (strain M1.001 / M2 / FGSC 10212) TaxID=645133 RepID=E3QAB0_COLGM|nr:lysophospholipase catalytic domain-containing protein [Colletotrichum graminicola M1.001]EFQ27798.1 lysophospholipase catalytic domain-containing protein [Colletotrichum graminicola M1.001]WDK11502.1 lysophospholipase catalytic domain-containing protein [Colletotrichum graminicola]